MEISYPVPCPLVDGREIPIYTCFAMHCVVDNDNPEFIAPSEMRVRQNYREICKACRYHRDD